MEHYTYHQHLKQIWEDAVAQYRDGNREPDTYFDQATLDELASVGLGVMDVYDYAEDFVSRGEPDFETFLLICEVRRDYFLNVQKGQPSDNTLDPDTLPPKDAETRGIGWLPRIIPKALAKLRGELPRDTMYGCGGDRKFLRQNNIHPAEFLRVAWAYGDEPEKLVDWVEARRGPALVESPS